MMNRVPFSDLMVSRDNINNMAGLSTEMRSFLLEIQTMSKIKSQRPCQLPMQPNKNEPQLVREDINTPLKDIQEQKWLKDDEVVMYYFSKMRNE